MRSIRRPWRIPMILVLGALTVPSAGVRGRDLRSV